LAFVDKLDRWAKVDMQDILVKRQKLILEFELKKTKSESIRYKIARDLVIPYVKAKTILDRRTQAEYFRTLLYELYITFEVEFPENLRVDPSWFSCE
jgi:hypothetical protein